MKNRRGHQGFALILALLALMLLTSLGLSLSTTTSTELQIATNHRWAEQARYNAEAGIEIGKELLTTIPDWSVILPPARVTGWAANATVPGVPTDAPQTRNDWVGNPTRNFENSGCDSRGYGRGYGVVFDPPGATQPYQFTNEVGGFPLNGAFTLWIRRPVMWQSNSGSNANTLQDYTGNDVLILVSEGVAPFNGAGGARAGSARRATQIIETIVSQGAQGQNIVVAGETQCSTRQGQSGGSASGSNSQGCSVLDGTTLLPAVAGAQNLGTGALK